MKKLEDYINNSWIFDNFDDEYKKNHYESLNENELRIIENDFYTNKFDLDIIYGGKSYPTYRVLLYERLEESLDSNLLIEKLKNIKHITKTSLTSSKYIINIYIDDEFDNDKENYTKFESLLNFFNYFISRKQKTSNGEKIIRIEARKPEKIKEEDTLPFVYHITTKSAWEKIKRVGLSNKNHNKKSNHPKRIYCLSSKMDKYSVYEYGKMLYKDDDFIILKINTNKFKEDRENIDKETISFYGDPQTPLDFGMFTLEYIPSKYIEKIDL